MRRLVRYGILMIGSGIVASAAPANLAQVDAKVWRSGQPKAADFAELQARGFVQVLNLREYHKDDEKAEHTPLSLQRVKMNAAAVSENDLVRAVRILKDAPGPVLVHCWHGSDRTGTVVALYRMAVQGWPREKAIAEFLDPRYGHHASAFPNLRRYLEKVDIAAVRTAVHSSRL